MSPPSEDDAATGTAAPTERTGGVNGFLPDATVESRWWYWIAAVPVYFCLSVVLGALLFATVVLGVWIDAGVMFSGPFLFALAAVLFGLPGLLLSVVFPVAVYVDARAVREADVGWDPDLALYGVVALAAVLVTAFTASVPVAIYYLYRRHEAVGVP